MKSSVVAGIIPVIIITFIGNVFPEERQQAKAFIKRIEFLSK